MKIEVGEYIRTKNGVIAQLEYIHDKDEVYWFDKVIYSRYGEEIDFLTTEELPKYIVNHSKNILDLVEVGDYLDGVRVTETFINNIKYLAKDYINKTIVTKEQFSNMEYKI